MGGLLARTYSPGVSFQAPWGLRGESHLRLRRSGIAAKSSSSTASPWNLRAVSSRRARASLYAGTSASRPTSTTSAWGRHAAADAVVRPTPHLGSTCSPNGVDRRDGRGRAGRLFTATSLAPRRFTCSTPAFLRAVDRPVHRDAAVTSLSTVSRSARDVDVLGVDPVRVQANGRPSCSSATATTAASSRAARRCCSNPERRFLIEVSYAFQQ